MLERAEHIAEWIRLTEAKEKPEQVVQVSSGGRGKEGGISAAARQLPIAGKTDDAKRMNAQRAVKIAERTTAEAKEVAREVGLAKPSRLLVITYKK